MFLAGGRDERQRERAKGGNWHIRNSMATTSMVRSAAAAAAAGVPFVGLARTKTRANTRTMQVGPSFMYAIYTQQCYHFPDVSYGTAAVSRGL